MKKEIIKLENKLKYTWDMAREINYIPLSNLWDIFFEIDNEDEVIPKVKEVLDIIKSEIRLVAELTLVVNHLSWLYADDMMDNQVMSEAFAEAYHYVRDFVYKDNSIYTDKEMDIYFHITD